MGINVRVQNAPKQSGIIVAQVKLEKDLRSCMRCRFFTETTASASLRNVSRKKASLKLWNRTQRICVLNVHTDGQKSIAFPA